LTRHHENGSDPRGACMLRILFSFHGLRIFRPPNSFSEQPILAAAQAGWLETQPTFRARRGLVTAGASDVGPPALALDRLRLLHNHPLAPSRRERTEAESAGPACRAVPTVKHPRTSTTSRETVPANPSNSSTSSRVPPTSYSILSMITDE